MFRDRADWEQVLLTEVLDFREGPGIMARDFRESGIPLLRLAGLKRGANLLDGCNYLDDKMASTRWNHFRLLLGDVLLSTSASLGEVAVVDESAVGAVPYTGIIRFRPTGERICPEFVQFALTAPFFKRQVEEMGVGSVMRHFGPTHLVKMAIDLPPVPMQRAIASALGAIDDKIKINDKIASTSLTLAQALYEEASKSESWHTLSMGQCAHWLSGGTPSTTESSFWDGDIPWISALSLKSPWIADSDRKVTQLGVDHGTRVVPRGAVLFVVRGSSLDTEFRIGLTQREVAFGQDCKALLAAKGLDPVVLFLAIRSRSSDILNLVDHTGHGAGRLATDLITNVLLRLPDPSLRAVISGHLRYLVDLGAWRQSENRTLLELRDTLLPRLMSGEIRLQDAERIVEGAT